MTCRDSRVFAAAEKQPCAAVGASAASFSFSCQLQLQLSAFSVKRRRPADGGRSLFGPVVQVDKRRMNSRSERESARTAHCGGRD